MSRLFLGLDCSTQSFTGIILDYKKKKILIKSSVIFDKELPHFGTKNGTITLEDQKVIHSPPLMWIEAFEKLLNKIKEKIDLSKVSCISGSAQQHGTVYLNNDFGKVLSTLDSNIPLSAQLSGCFSRRTAPIWMDSSTYEECSEIRRELGGIEKTVEITGSNTFERFSGPQIRKYFKRNPEKYRITRSIHLISSLFASILLGTSAPIDYADGAGMNLMNIKTKKWDSRALEATAPDLIDKLPALASSNTILGNISPYFVNRFGFQKDAYINIWSGDNANSLIGVGLIKSGKVSISLGTSDTYFSYMKNLFLDFNGEGHVFRAPTGDYMSLICFKNGSITREMIKNKYNLTWKQFSEILSKSTAGNAGNLMLPYYLPEIVPLVLDPKVYKFGFEEDKLEYNIRGLIEAQFMSMKLHSSWIGEKPTEILVTGGGSQNLEISQIAANIFQTPVRVFQISDSAALGATFRAIKSYYDFHSKHISWETITSECLNLEDSVVLRPDSSKKDLYNDLTMLYNKFERYILHNAENPEKERIKFIKKYYS